MSVTGKRRQTVILLLIVTAVLSGCREEVVNIGFISGLSGGNADLGEAGRNGAMIAVEEINASGGIHGKTVNLVIRDDGNTYDQAVKSAGELVDEKVVMIIGPFSTFMTEAVHSVTEPAKLLTLTPTASAMQITGKDDYLFKLNSSTRDNAGAYARQMHDKHGFGKVSIAADEQNRAFSESWVNEFTGQYKDLGGELLSASYFDSSTLDAYSTLVGELLEGDPDAILIVCSSVDTARLAQQIRKVDKNIPLVTSEWAGTRQLIELGGAAVEGMEVMQNVNLLGREPEFLSFMEKYRERFRVEPSFSSIMAYESVKIGAEALNLKSEEQSLKEAVIAGSPYQGLQQKIEFDRFGDSRRIPVFVSVQNRNYLPVE